MTPLGEAIKSEVQKVTVKARAFLAAFDRVLSNATDQESEGKTLN